MGQEIASGRFSEEVRAEFAARLREETKILKSWFDNRVFSYDEGFTGGLEVEAWLTDENALPAPRNVEFLAAADDPLIVAELSQFNFEINTAPEKLRPGFLRVVERDLARTWETCRNTAASLNLTPMLIGILPTVRDEMLQLDWMSPAERYKSLNEEVFRLRSGAPLHIRIEGEESLEMRCDHVMMEAACTSIQTHLQINQEEAARFWNASQIISAPIVAASSNSPFLYGKSLWAETRIPTFEQAVSVAAFRDIAGRPCGRVTFGAGYVRRSFLELFLENHEGYPSLLPALADKPAEKLAHLRLQNGTIWRWNRPIIGFNEDGAPHLRIEHRATAAGPTIADMVANMALYLGLALYYARMETPPETLIAFEAARENFYAAARYGLKSRLMWTDGRIHDAQALLLDRLLDEARKGLISAGLTKEEISERIDGVLRGRLMSGRGGAAWQRGFINTHGADFQAMTMRYAELQESGMPVHEWTV
ncbi:MAG: glutamate-cysteine ligase family protein [Parvularculaceae bacterium]